MSYNNQWYTSLGAQLSVSVTRTQYRYDQRLSILQTGHADPWISLFTTQDRNTFKPEGSVVLQSEEYRLRKEKRGKTSQQTDKAVWLLTCSCFENGTCTVIDLLCVIIWWCICLVEHLSGHGRILLLHALSRHFWAGIKWYLLLLARTAVSLRSRCSLGLCRLWQAFTNQCEPTTGPSGCSGSQSKHRWEERLHKVID